MKKKKKKDNFSTINLKCCAQLSDVGQDTTNVSCIVLHLSLFACWALHKNPSEISCVRLLAEIIGVKMEICQAGFPNTSRTWRRCGNI